MRVVFMGRKPDSIKALEFLLESGFDVPLVVAIPPHKPLLWKRRLWNYADKKGIPLVDNKGIYRLLDDGELKDIDLVISYLYPYRLKEPLLSLPRIGAINFHPAPLPELKGLGGYNVAILENMDYYGVSAHYMTEDIDSGDIIKVIRFPINPHKETAYSLERETRPYLLSLFKEVMMDIKEHGKPRGTPQKGGRYISRKEFESMKLIRESDSPELIERKIRAFFYPPYPGAEVELKGRRYTIISDEIMKEIGEKYHND